MPTRGQVYAAINTERDYQDALPPTRTDGMPRSVGDYITMMRTYARAADEAWTYNPGDAQALVQMRKIAGIAVHCMEDHGAPHRMPQPTGRGIPRCGGTIGGLAEPCPLDAGHAGPCHDPEEGTE
jgi:hypothetical protein